MRRALEVLSCGGVLVLLAAPFGCGSADATPFAGAGSGVSGTGGATAAVGGRVGSGGTQLTSGGAIAQAASSGVASGGMGGSSAGGSAGKSAGGKSAGGSAGKGAGGSAGKSAGGSAGKSSTTGGSAGSAGAGTPTDNLPPAGNPNGACVVPAEAALENTASPTSIVGTGTPASCSSTAFVNAVAKGGIITFNCGPDPLTILLDRTAKIVNSTGPKIVIDGGGKITLSGGGRVRILYMNTCDEAQTWTSPQCQNQDSPQLTVQNLTFVDGNSKGETFDGGGGGAIFVRGGRFKVINSRFFRNVCDDVGPDLGGAAIRTLSQYEGLPVYVVNSTFGGRDGLGNVCSNGGGLSSIGVSYTVINSLFTHNAAIGNGANPARNGTPGGGSGGAIYNDGNTYTLSLCGTQIANNTANEGGGAVFFVSNDRSGSLVIRDSTLSMNPSMGFETAGFPGIFVIARGDPQLTNSILQ